MDFSKIYGEFLNGRGGAEPLRGYNYLVEFQSRTIPENDAIKLSLNVQQVTLPQIKFKKEFVWVGPFKKYYPMYENDAHELSLTVLEDENMTCMKYANIFTRRQYSKGIHNLGSVNDDLQITVHVYNNKQEPIFKYIFKEISFLNSSGLGLGYRATNGPVTGELKFISNIVDIYGNR